MDKHEWLNSLKVGDKVISSSGYYGKSVSAVERVTPTQIVLPKGCRYWKKSGKAVGDTAWNIAYIEEPTDAILRSIRKERLCALLDKVTWQKLNLELLEEIFDRAKNGQHL